MALKIDNRREVYLQKCLEQNVRILEAVKEFRAFSQGMYRYQVIAELRNTLQKELGISYDEFTGKEVKTWEK